MPPLTVEAAAEILGVSPHTLRMWLRQRRLPYLKLGRTVRVEREALERFIDANRVAADSRPLPSGGADARLNYVETF